MLYFFLLCVLSAVGLSTAKQEYTDLPSDAVALLSEKAVGCITDSHADANILQRVFQWQFDNNEISKKFSFCLFTKAGLSDDAGVFHVDQVLNLFRNSDKKDAIRKVANECNEIQADDPLNKMYRSLQCFFKNTPVLLQLKSD